MTTPPDRARDGVEASARDLALLHVQVQDARDALSRLRQEIAAIEWSRDGERAAHLVEANERLIVAAVQAQGEVESTTRALNEASRAVGRDVVTDLPNRVVMLDRLQSAITLAARHGSQLALLFVDLDAFKLINDTRGHAVGDEVLRLAARTLLGAVREADTVSRHGGDEFLVLLTDVSQSSDAEAVAQKILAALAAGAMPTGEAMGLSASIGISVYPFDGDDAETLIDGADTAMYHAKRMGDGNVAAYGALDSDDRALVRKPTPRFTPALTSQELTRQEHERRYRELREANERLVLVALSAQQRQEAAEEALRRQSEYLALAAHDLRHPLGPIRHASAQLGLGREDSRILDRALSIIDRQVTRIERVVSDLADASRHKAPAITLDRRVLDLAGIVKAAVRTSEAALRSRAQRLTVQLPPQPLMIDADADRLSQVLDNLLDNASRFSPKGGQIRVTADVVDDVVRLTVADEGVGIAPDALLGIFDLFAHEPRSRAPEDAGLGIGLAVVRDLVEAHGGSVRATSAGVGLGSQFAVTLPLHTPSAPPAERPPTPPAVRDD